MTDVGIMDRSVFSLKKEKFSSVTLAVTVKNFFPWFTTYTSIVTI